MTGVGAEFLIFELSGVRYGLPAETILEVVRAARFVPVPEQPSIVEGVLDIRGRMAPVLDIRARLGLPPQAMTTADHIILARRRDRVVALRVDQAVGLAALAPEAIEPAENVVPHGGRIAGIARTPDGIVLIQDLDRFLTEAEERDLPGDP